MGRLLNQKEIVNLNTKEYLERSTSNYSVFLEGTPSFVTYYRKNKTRSTVDDGLENVQSHLGNASPKYYDKINDLPIYGIDTISLELSREDIGLETKFDGKGVILPTTIKPLPNDYFYITYINDIYLFRINNVLNDKLEGRQFYAIDFSFNKKFKKGEQIEIDGQIIDDYQVVYDNIGTDKKCVLLDKDYIFINKIEEFYNKLLDKYTKFFYNDNYNIFSSCEYYHNYKLYNQFATNFIHKNNLFKRKKEFMNTIICEDILKQDKIYNHLYEETIYHALETKSSEQLCGLYCLPIMINEPHTPFYFSNDKFFKVLFTDTISETSFLLFDEKFIENIKNNILYNDKYNPYIFENIIIDYINNNFIITEDIINDLDNMYIDCSDKNFLLIPMILYILKDNLNNLINKITL